MEPWQWAYLVVGLGQIAALLVLHSGAIRSARSSELLASAVIALTQEHAQTFRALLVPHIQDRERQAALLGELQEQVRHLSTVSGADTPPHGTRVPP